MDPDRSRFEHLYVETSVACGRLVPRFRLWMALREAGADPDRLRRRDALAFCERGLTDFLAAEGLALSRWRRRRLVRAVRFFDPATTTPEEILARIDGEHA